MSYFSSYSFPNGVRLRNHFVMAPMTTYSGNPDGTISNAELKYYRLRAQSAGMIVTGTTYTIPEGQGFDNQFYGGNDSFLASLASLADSIQSQGAKAVLQVFHPGRMAKPGLSKTQEIVSASNIPAERETAAIPRTLTETEINRIINSFYDTCRRAIRAGFDGIEIHGANSYLIQQFFSPHSNRRDDAWGGSIEKRMRFPLAIVEACLSAKKDAQCPDFLIGYRFSPEEKENPGITLADTGNLLDALANTDLDYLHISLGHYAQTSVRDKDDTRIVGQFVQDILTQRKPLIGVGSIFTEDDLAAASNIDYTLLASGRGFLVDPLFPDTLKKTGRIQRVLHPQKHSLPKELFARVNEHKEAFGIEIYEALD